MHASNGDACLVFPILPARQVKGKKYMMLSVIYRMKSLMRISAFAAFSNASDNAVGAASRG